jgi:molecular chaperone Hsp33
MQGIAYLVLNDMTPSLSLPKDCLQRFILKDLHVRGQWIHLDRAYTAIQSIHPYPITIRMLIGEALAASALISSTLKYEGRTTLQIEGPGPIKLLLAQCNHLFHLRGLAKWDEDIDLTSSMPLFSGAQCLISITQATSQETYNGIIPLEHDNLALCLESYFQRSEQLPTKFYFASTHEHIVGLMLQSLPDDAMTEDMWQHVTCLADTLTQPELLSVAPMALMNRLFHDEDMQWFIENPVEFKCSCSKEKSEKAVITFGEEEVMDVFNSTTTLVVNCEFCNQSYEFDKIDVYRIFHPSPNSSQSSH